MKVSRTLAALLLGSLFVNAPTFAQADGAAKAEPSAQALLTRMAEATQQLSYELTYINVAGLGIEPMRYRHALINGRHYAQLLQMDGPRREVVQRDKNVSYFDASSGIDAFTLPGRQIIDGIPPILYADIAKLAPYYDFISVGRARVADRMCEVVRIVSQDGSRYSYVVWLDEATKLPLRIDLLGQDGTPIDQFQVTHFQPGAGIEPAMRALQSAQLPPVITTLPRSDKSRLNWTPGWLPAGVQQISQSHRQLPNRNQKIASRLFSDGLFSFTVNVSDADAESRNQTYSTGRRTVLIKIRNNKEISVVGELPRQTANRIADSVKLGYSK